MQRMSCLSGLLGTMLKQYWNQKASERTVDEPPQPSWVAALRIIGEESFDDVDVCVSRHVSIPLSNDVLDRETPVRRSIHLRSLVHFCLKRLSWCDNSP